MNTTTELGARRWERQDAARFRPPATERVADSVDISRADARQLAQLERALQGLKFSEGGPWGDSRPPKLWARQNDLVSSWCVVRKRMMKRACGGDGPFEAARREAVKRFLEKKRAKRFGAARKAEVAVWGEGEPMDEGGM
eukprot:evm.model.scf_194.11 EVM.evm.TU.scf_194.11   scf_194:118730-119149(+)